MDQVSVQVSLKGVKESVGSVGALANILRGRGPDQSRIGEFDTGATLVTEVRGQERLCFLVGGPEAVEHSRQKIEALMRGEKVSHVLFL